MKKGINRRNFIKSASFGAAAFSIVPASVLGANAPSNKLNIAGVGVGGMGGGNIRAMESENIVALCDVDWNKASGTFGRYPDAKQYKDFRVMLDKMGDQIDAVMVATPDHTHACVALEAMKRGKHVYVQKPLTKTVYEARLLTEAARKYGVITQMGNQGHSGEGIRLICEWIWDGAIGDVREVHAWTNRPIWPQGLKRPTDTPAVPDYLDWDLFLGPVEGVAYNPVYHPWNWRAWTDFGTGALGDMACHILDPVFWALKLKYASSVQGSYAYGYYEGKRIGFEDTFPVASKIHLEYPSRESMPAVKVNWYDGGILPERPAELESGRRMGDSDGGVIFVGDKGKIMCGCYAKNPQIIPYSEMKKYNRPAKTIERVNTSHEMNWVEAIKNNKQASSNFDYAGPFTEMVLMGNLSLYKPGHKLEWDGDKMEVTNYPELNKYVNPARKAGWEL